MGNTRKMKTMKVPIIGEIKDGKITYYKKTAKNKGGRLSTVLINK